MESKTNSGSKTNLNESTMPLLDDENPTPDKENIELTETASASSQEKDDSGTEKKDKEKEKEEKKKEKERKKQEKKEKKLKEKQEKKEKAKNAIKKPSPVTTMTVGLDLNERDANSINHVVNINFDNVIAEPENSHGLDFIWRLTFLLFSMSKLWIYKIISALLAAPLALLWGVVFSVLTVVHVWLVVPALKVFDVFMSIVRSIWNTLMLTFVEPPASALGAFFRSMRVHHTRLQETV